MTAAHWVVAMLVTVSALYTGAAVAYFLNGKPGMAVAFIGYVLANAGLIYDALR